MVADGKIIIDNKPSQVKQGDPIDVNVTTKNTGDITGKFNLQMAFDGVSVESTPSFNLNPGSTQQHTMSHNAPTVGTSTNVELNLYKVVDIADFASLKPYLVSGYIGENWWDFTEPERRRIAETAIRNVLFYEIGSGRYGNANCAGGTGGVLNFMCGHNATIRALKFGRTSITGGDESYYNDLDGNEHCFVPNERFDLPCDYIVATSHDGCWGHSLCGIRVNKNIDDLNSWIMFQYSDFDIKPGDWQIPTALCPGIDIQISEPTHVYHGGTSATRIKTFNL